MNEPTQLCDINAEAGVVSCMLVDRSCVPMVMSEITPDDISSKKNRLVYEAIHSLTRDGEPVDPLTVLGRLKDTNVFNKDIGEHLNYLSDFVISAVHVKSYMDTVKKYSALRKVYALASTMQSSILSTKSIDSVTGTVNDIMMAAVSATRQKPTGIKELLDMSLGYTCSMAEGKSVPTISYGWEQHDRILKGMNPGNLIIIGARPGMGKSQYMLNIARKLVPNKKAVYIKTLEMSDIEITDRLINMNSVDGRYFSVERHKKQDMDIDYVMSLYDQTYSQLAEQKLSVDDISSDDTVMLKSKMKQKKMEGLLDVCMLDYLQLMPKNKMQMQHADPMGQISRELKLAAKEVEVPIIALAQLNRNATIRQNKRPSLEDLRESGAIEQDADVVILLHRTDYYQETSESRGILEVIVAKNRHGPTGVIKMMYDRPLGLMGEIDEKDLEYYEYTRQN